MKKTGKRIKIETKDAESQIREILRKFAQEILNTQKLRDSAAKAIGKQPSYIKAMLMERNKGGLNTWATMLDHCFSLRGLNLVTEISRALENPDGLSSGNTLTKSETIFRNLEKYPIVNEDVKLEVATMLDKVFNDVQKNHEKLGSKK
jgi:hypothetical protein